MVLLIMFGLGVVHAQEKVCLKENFPKDYQYRISTRVELAGQLLPPPEKGKPRPPLAFKGISAIDYDERVLSAQGNQPVEKTIRLYRRMDFERKIGEQVQKPTMREEVRRQVVMRRGKAKVPFCPEGPLTWSEIDLVRTDVFTPALAGLLPDGPVREGDRWTASTPAIQELTDLEQIEEAKVECRLERVIALEKRRYAWVVFTGTVRGNNEDGLNRHQLEGYLYFDLESNHLSYLSLRGLHTMLDKDGKEAGRVEGQFVMTRQAHTRARELSDQALAGLDLEPNADNTLLLYDNPDLGLRFRYPRRWRVAGGLGRQVRLDGADGSGLLITLEAPGRTPTGIQFQAESQEWFRSRKDKIFRAEPPQRLAGTSFPLEHFALDVEAGGQRVFMDYYVTRQEQGGATLAARLATADLTVLQKEVERIARSLTITQTIKSSQD
jgi:hypothetical protein